MPLPKYPNVTATLVGQDGNAFNLLGIVANEMRKAKIPKEEIDAFTKEAMSGDYDNLLRTCMTWVNVE